MSKEKIKDVLEKRKKLVFSQRQARNVISQMSKDFMVLLCFMVIYRKYPYNLAYLRITEILRFLDAIQCKNKLEIIGEELFDGIEDIDEAQHIIEHYYHFIKNKTANEKIKNSSRSHKNDKDYAQYQLSHYFYSPEDYDFNSLQTAKNLLNFKKLFLMAMQDGHKPFLRSSDFWHYVCEYLLMEDNNFQMFVFGPEGKNLIDILEEA